MACATLLQELEALDDKSPVERQRAHFNWIQKDIEPVGRLPITCTSNT